MIFPLIGNENINRAISNAVSSHRIPHAIIIEGEDGLGKSSLALFIAKALLCSQSNAPCGICKACHLLDVGSHPDCFYVSPEEKKKNITVDQIRDLRIKAYQKPQMADTSVFIIDRAETLNQQSQNTLLKVLEEPPGNAVFIFLTLSTAALLNTVVSRCVVYSLNPVLNTLATDFLVKQKGISEQAAKEAITQSHGNIGRALNIIAGQETNGEKQLAEQYKQAVFKGEVYKMLAITAEFEKDRIAADRFVSELRLTFLEELRADKQSSRKLKYILKLIEITDSLVAPLKTNINLPLLFTAAAYSYYDCKL